MIGPPGQTVSKATQCKNALFNLLDQFFKDIKL